MPSAMRSTAWCKVFPRLVCVFFFLESSSGFVLSWRCPSRFAQTSQPLTARSCVCSPPKAASRLPQLLLSPTGIVEPALRCPSSSSMHLSSRAASALAARAFSIGGIAQKSTTVVEAARGRSRTALSGSNGGSFSDNSDEVTEGEGDVDAGGKDGWRQRMVRTILTAFLRIRATVNALKSRLGLDRFGKKSEAQSNQSLFRSSGKGAGAEETPRDQKGLARFRNKKTAVLAAIALVATAVVLLSTQIPTETEVPMSTFMNLMEGKESKNIVDGIRVVRSGKIYYRMDGKNCFTQPLNVSKEVFKVLSKSGMPFSASKSAPVASRTLSSLFPIGYIAAIYFFVIKKGQRDMVGTTGKLAASSDLDKSLTFSDVAGVDQAKSQVQELVSMIKDPGPFIAAGARLPSGLLMVGPPGTGKTLMARVMAAEAGVPFYYCSGSDFVEMFVGRGAARVRNLFTKAAKTAPCIVFLDELDALGKERSSAGGRQTNDEAEQTLNQLLASMDGLDTNNNGVMVIAATNRYEVLDSALTRPGRFDRVVRVEVPDVAGREAILKIHTRKMIIEETSVFKTVAEMTQGLAGAELATIANEAAISAARRGSQSVVPRDFMDSVQNFYVSRKKGDGGLQGMFKGMLSN